MILRYSVEQIYAAPGFAEMVAEYAKMADPDMPPPTYRKEDYLLLESEERLGVYVALHEDKVVGFVAVMRSYLPKVNTMVAITESLYVMRKYRIKGYGWRLIDAVEDFARINGLKHSFINIPHNSLKTLGVVLGHRNYSLKLHTYGKTIC